MEVWREAMIEKAVITAGGLGTRLLPTTKETPKEMLPLFYRKKDGRTGIKPLLQMVFEQLHGFGIKDFIFITGRGKRSIEDHFTPHQEFLKYLNEVGKDSEAAELEEFYERVRSSRIFWTTQPEPKGFGDAVSLAEPYIGSSPFLVFAGDTYIISKNFDYLKRLVECFESYQPKACLLLFRVEDPRPYGVILGDKMNERYVVKRAVEKPKEPISNLAILPLYVFDPIIFKALEKVGYDAKGEKQLTDAIQKLIDWGFEVNAVELKGDEKRLDIGTVEFYAEALKLSLEYSRGDI